MAQTYLPGNVINPVDNPFVTFMVIQKERV
jgi:hypothetical protein